jgi:hypothetical protein
VAESRLQQLLELQEEEVRGGTHLAHSSPTQSSTWERWERWERRKQPGVSIMAKPAMRGQAKEAARRGQETDPALERLQERLQARPLPCVLRRARVARNGDISAPVSTQHELSTVLESQRYCAAHVHKLLGLALLPRVRKG